MRFTTDEYVARGVHLSLYDIQAVRQDTTVTAACYVHLTRMGRLYVGRTDGGGRRPRPVTSVASLPGAAFTIIARSLVAIDVGKPPTFTARETAEIERGVYHRLTTLGFVLANKVHPSSHRGGSLRTHLVDAGIDALVTAVTSLRSPQPRLADQAAAIVEAIGGPLHTTTIADVLAAAGHTISHRDRETTLGILNRDLKEIAGYQYSGRRWRTERRIKRLSPAVYGPGP